MSSQAKVIEARLKALGIDLPAAVAPIANYVPFVRTGSLLIVSGQLPLEDGKLTDRYKGKLGKDVFNEAGQQAARLAAINVLAQAQVALGDLDRVRRVVRLGGFINATPGFTALAMRAPRWASLNFPWTPRWRWKPCSNSNEERPRLAHRAPHRPSRPA